MTKLEAWHYSPDKLFRSGKLHIDVIADYGGGHTLDPAFTEVQNHFFRHDRAGLIEIVTQTPIHAFSTIETGFWIAQEALHSDHPNLVIFSNTAPRGAIAWEGQKEQALVCGILDNGIPVFAVNAGFNVSFVKERLVGLWEVDVPNVGTQFRSRDQYPEAAVAILRGDVSRVGKPIDVSSVPEVPPSRVASIDGYGNIKTTIRKTHVPEAILRAKRVSVSVSGKTLSAVNSLSGNSAKEGELKIGVGSSGGKKDPFVEIVRMKGSASDDFGIDAPRDDLGTIVIEPV